MAESAKLLVDDLLQGDLVRQWVLSLPIPLHLLLAKYPKHLSKWCVVDIKAPLNVCSLSRSRWS